MITDVAVVGLGAIGSAALATAAGRGFECIGIEQFGIGHANGASGGGSRIFRLAYKEGSSYLPLLRESLDRWRSLQADSSTSFWFPTGTITIGAADHPDIIRLRQCIADGGLSHEVLPATEAIRRWPQHRFASNDIVVHDPSGGLLIPDLAIRAQVHAAQRDGAEVLVDTRVAAIDRDAYGFEVRLDTGECVSARRVIVACGAWASDLVPDADRLAELRRVVLHWYPTSGADEFGPGRFPVGIRHRTAGHDFSFFPRLDATGIKVNWYVPKLVVDHAATEVNPVPSHYSAGVSSPVPEVFDGVEAAPSAAAAYVESYTPDRRPYIGAAGGGDRLCVVTGGSGQAFKMSPALGRLAVDVAFGTSAGMQ